MTNLFDLSGEVAVVLGATGALGAAMAHALAGAGAAVAVVGRNAERGEGVVRELPVVAGTHHFIAADTADTTALQRMHQAVLEQLGSPTILVNAVGGNDPKVTITPERPLERIDAEDLADELRLESPRRRAPALSRVRPGHVRAWKRFYHQHR